MGVVLMELLIRSRRDPAIARLLQQLDAGWRGYLVHLLERGIRASACRCSPLSNLNRADARVGGVGHARLIEVE
jgi:hypothetical protein